MAVVDALDAANGVAEDLVRRCPVGPEPAPSASGRPGVDREGPKAAYLEGPRRTRAADARMS
jgi:hypothetical protein